jgi:dTDP-4-dehydrorhamnose 3,5-epimerase-like enzyme
MVIILEVKVVKKRNIWKVLPKELELHEDKRGRIVDVFYNENINHVAVIDSKKRALRGNHYHKKSTQYMLMTKGSMIYYYKKADSEDYPRHIIIKEGDLVETPPNEIHILYMLEDSQFIAFAKGLRGGKDYEKDTFRTIIWEP